MHHRDTLDSGAVLLDILSRVRRRYRMPALPRDVEEARAGGPEVCVAYALENARVALDRGAAPNASLRSMFMTALADLIGAALQPGSGDSGFQVLVLRSQSAEVDEFMTLAGSAGADRRAVIAAVNALAHPAKIRVHSSTGHREVLARLHGLAMSDGWGQLRRLVESLLSATLSGNDLLRRSLASLHEHPALLRLARGEELGAHADVRRYHALRASGGPLAGSDVALEQGRVSGRRGDENEARAADALTALAAAVESPGHTRARYRVVTSLRVPAGFPGHPRNAKSEWDVALVRESDDGTAAELCLLVEVKSAPDAAVADFPRLVRGLGRLAQAQADAAYAFACREGTLRIHGLSLQRRSAPPYTLPPSVFYACAAAEGRPSMLSAASKGLLLAQAGCLAFARAIADGRSTDVEALGAVWADVTTAPHLRSVLRQYDVARIVRESMRHPDDLKAAAAPA